MTKGRRNSLTTVIIDPTINLFKNQLNGEIQKLVSEQGFDSAGKAFQYWYFKNIWNFEDDLIEEIDTDGGQDQGIDAIYIDDENIVHFFQFKNIGDLNKNYPQGEAEKTFAGIALLQSGEYKGLVNTKLKEQFEQVLKAVRKHYIVHLISPAQGLAEDAKRIFQIRIDDLNKYGEKYSLSVTDIFGLTEEHTKKLRFKVRNPIVFPRVNNPYFTKNREHTSYFFTASGKDIAEIYEKYKDKLLEQNVRANLGKKNSTNAAIYNSCTSDNSKYFCHYNNGITFLCDSSEYDAFTSTVTIDGAQIVNGGQTASTLYQAYTDGKLKDDVFVPVRTINSDKDSDFGANVAINLNNQTKIDSSFLKSNHPVMLRVQDDLAKMGYIYERRGFEFDNLDEEKEDFLAKKYGIGYKSKIIPQKDSAKAYTAFFRQLVQLAKKDSGKIFIDEAEGGSFENIFDTSFSTIKLLTAYTIYTQVLAIVDDFNREKRKKSPLDYTKYTNLSINADVTNLMNKIMAQATIFILGLIFVIRFNKSEIDSESYIKKFSEYFKANSLDLIKHSTDTLLGFFLSGKIAESRTTDSILKSQNIYDQMVKYVEENGLSKELNF